MATRVPTLSLLNWLDNVNQKMNKIFEHFLASEYSQSTLFPRQVASLKYCMASTGDMERIRNDIKDQLRILYNNYFDMAEVIVTYREEDTVVTFSIEITVSENGESYTLLKAIDGDKQLGKITKWHLHNDELHENL